MSNAIFTKSGELRKNPPPKYVYRHNKKAVPNSQLKTLKLPGISFYIGPNGEALDDNPDYQKWMELKNNKA